ncbi:SsgA family sporulation/cell division regulator [Streptomyces pactum]|uniref:SsgA family sporulation/cell division regulator n=1 Tax=Streptomyces pactum TaxID=68249 RepID=A0ABS0NLB9_9ACTN|nr:SsgA family sporulation/cell division regulator [Streptomyces pactum]MBH5335897.1 SsgA family sporulation/cell division regulator [Streptomyces pactum]
MRDTVQAEVTMSFVVSQDLSFRIPVELAYDSNDPYAVEITFHLPGDAPVTWAFARELLLDGLSRPSGEGDVHIAPAGPETLGGNFGSPLWGSRADGSRGRGAGEVAQGVFIQLQVGGERALFRSGTAPLVAFLDRTDRLVPFGEEREVGDPVADLDAELDRILAEDRYAG